MKKRFIIVSALLFVVLVLLAFSINKNEHQKQIVLTAQDTAITAAQKQATLDEAQLKVAQAQTKTVAQELATVCTDLQATGTAKAPVTLPVQCTD